MRDAYRLILWDEWRRVQQLICAIVDISLYGMIVEE